MFRLYRSSKEMKVLGVLSPLTSKIHHQTTYIFMKNLFTFLLFLGTFQLAIAQTSAPKYLLFEHFTNTNCGVCASQNPSFFNTIANYPDNVHHIAYHPPFPYQQCVFYQANTSENEDRTSFYSIFGTPRIVWNGTFTSSPAGVSASEIEDRIAETSPIAIEVEESGGISRSVSVKVHTFGEQPTGNLKIFAAVVEKEVEYNAPNGEDLHHNVFREMLTSISGDNFSAASTGEATTLNYSYQVDTDWVLSETYVVVFVQDLNTGEILNSGTKFDEPISSTFTLAANQSFDIFPNPTSNLLNVQIKNIELTHNQLLIFNSLGQIVSTQNINPLNKTYEINMAGLPEGNYWIRLQAREGFLVKNVAKAKQ